VSGGVSGNHAIQKEGDLTVFERIQHMLIKEFIQIFRDPKVRALVLLTPIVQMLVFGYAVSTDVRHIETAVYDLDNTVASRDLVSRFVRTGYFDVSAYVANERHLRDLIDHSRARAVIQIDKGFENDLRSGRTARVQIVLDGIDSITAGMVLDYSAKIAERFSRQILVDRLAATSGAARAPGQVDLKTRAWFNENLESRHFYVPGVIAILVMLITLLLTSLAVVREKEAGTIEQIMVTPMSRAEFILGKTVPFVLIAFFDVLVIVLVCVFWFDVPLRGSISLLFFATALYLMTSLGVGLLISTVSETQQQAVMTTFFFFFPAVLLSGFVFPIANMPVVVQWFTFLDPLRYFMKIVRGIFLKGIGFDVLWPELLALAVMGVCVLSLATRRFKKTMA
jgi:ABC-2 type transport system permease protein